jgi:aurora kinase
MTSKEPLLDVLVAAVAIALLACRYQVAREIRMHSELCHNNIISLYCAWKDANFIYVAVEWAPNGDIFHVMKSWGKQGVSEGVVMTTVSSFCSCG